MAEDQQPTIIYPHIKSSLMPSKYLPWGSHISTANRDVRGYLLWSWPTYRITHTQTIAAVVGMLGVFAACNVMVELYLESVALFLLSVVLLISHFRASVVDRVMAVVYSILILSSFSTSLSLLHQSDCFWNSPPKQLNDVVGCTVRPIVKCSAQPSSLPSQTLPRFAAAVVEASFAMDRSLNAALPSSDTTTTSALDAPVDISKPLYYGMQAMFFQSLFDVKSASWPARTRRSLYITAIGETIGAAVCALLLVYRPLITITKRFFKHLSRLAPGRHQMCTATKGPGSSLTVAMLPSFGRAISGGVTSFLLVCGAAELLCDEFIVGVTTISVGLSAAVIECILEELLFQMSACKRRALRRSSARCPLTDSTISTFGSIALFCAYLGIILSASLTPIAHQRVFFDIVFNPVVSQCTRQPPLLHLSHSRITPETARPTAVVNAQPPPTIPSNEIISEQDHFTANIIQARTHSSARISTTQLSRPRGDIGWINVQLRVAICVACAVRCVHILLQLTGMARNVTNLVVCVLNKLKSEIIPIHNATDGISCRAGTSQRVSVSTGMKQAPKMELAHSQVSSAVNLKSRCSVRKTESNGSSSWNETNPKLDVLPSSPQINVPLDCGAMDSMVSSMLEADDRDTASRCLNMSQPECITAPWYSDQCQESSNNTISSVVVDGGEDCQQNTRLSSLDVGDRESRGFPSTASVLKRTLTLVSSQSTRNIISQILAVLRGRKKQDTISVQTEGPPDSLNGSQYSVNLTYSAVIDTTPTRRTPTRRTSEVMKCKGSPADGILLADNFQPVREALTCWTAGRCVAPTIPTLIGTMRRETLNPTQVPTRQPREHRVESVGDCGIERGRITADYCMAFANVSPKYNDGGQSEQVQGGYQFQSDDGDLNAVQSHDHPNRSTHAQNDRAKRLQKSLFQRYIEKKRCAEGQAGDRRENPFTPEEVAAPIGRCLES